MQQRLLRIGEELAHLDTVFTGMNQLQIELEDLALQVNNFDAFHKDVDRVDADLLVSLTLTHHFYQLLFQWKRSLRFYLVKNFDGTFLKIEFVLKRSTWI